MKKIEDIRKDINLCFDKNSSLGFTNDFHQSKYGLYYFEVEHFKQNDINRNWIVSKIYIGHIEKTKKIFELTTDNDDLCFEWLLINNKDYLILPEIQGGQSVFSVENEKLYSYYSDEDPFIWTDIYKSPCATKLAVIGCYWGYPSELIIFNCTEITKLPYPYI